jgi:hypothetical protein
MIPRAVLLCGIVVVLAGVAHAQTQPGSQSPPQRPVSSTDAAPLPADAQESTTPPTPGILRRVGTSGDRQILVAPETKPDTKPLWWSQVDFGARRFSGEAPRDAIAPPTNPNAPWKVSGGFSYASRDGSVASIGLLGHRNDRMPVYLFQPLGGDDLTLPLASFSDLSRREIQWELTASIRKTLKRTSGGPTISAVADVSVPLNKVAPLPGSGDQPVLPSRADRFGLLFGF